MEKGINSETAPHAAEKKSKKPLFFPRPVRWLRECIAILLWLLFFAQLFIVDIMSDLASRYPIFELSLRFRLLIILGAICVFWLVSGNRFFTRFFVYIIAYPFVVLFWHIPRLLFHNWAIAVAFSPAFYSILKTFKFNVIWFVVALITSFVICFATNRLLIIGSMLTLAAYLFLHFFRRLRIAFSPSTIFAQASEAIGNVWNHIKIIDITKRPQGLDPNSEEYKQKFGANLLTMYMVTCGLHIMGERLNDVVNSRKLDIYFLSSLVYTFILTSIIFALQYYGLERLKPGSFVGMQEPNLLGFLGLSFSTLMTSDISSLRPISGLAQGIMYIQLFSSLLIIILLVFVILTSIRERYKQDLDSVVNELRTASNKMDALLEENYELTIFAAEAWLLKSNEVFIKWILKLRYGEQRIHQIEEQNNYAENSISDEKKS